MFGHIAQMPDESDTKQILTASPFGDLEETTGTPPYYAANLIVRVYLHSFFVLVSERRIFSTKEYASAAQGHPRSMILVPIGSAYAYGVSNTKTYNISEMVLGARPL